VTLGNHSIVEIKKVRKRLFDWALDQVQGGNEFAVFDLLKINSPNIDSLDSIQGPVK
jgi:hypothetical protein